MMKSAFPVGLFAGLASTLLFASIGSGSMLSLLLIQFAPLPIMIAAIGWGQAAGLIATGIAALCILAAFGVEIGVLHIVSVGLPAWWLSHLALLARPGSDGSPEWYPVGRILLWIAAITIALSCFAMLITGGSVSGYETVLRENLGRAFELAAAGMGPLPEGTSRDDLLNLAVVLLPPMVAAGSLLITTFNLWAASRITRASNRLSRPWPDLAWTILPNILLPALTIALLASLLPDLGGFIGRIAAAVFLMVLTLVGLATIHVGTRPLKSRSFMLMALYVLLIFQIGAALIVAIIGLAEQIFGLRARFAARRSPPPPPIH